MGRAIAVRFIEQGAKVVLVDILPCDETLANISKIKNLPFPVNDITLSIKCDLSVEEDIKKMVEETHAKFGDKIHVLVNNAAKFTWVGVEHASAEDWDKSNAVNIRGHALVTKYCLKGLKESKEGSIIFLASISSFLGQPDLAVYATMKAANLQMARNCAYDFAKYNIRVNSLVPGPFRTPITEEHQRTHKLNDEDFERLNITKVMLGRMGHVRELANAALFLASDESSYCTGSHLTIDGGFTASTTMNFPPKSKL